MECAEDTENPKVEGDEEPVKKESSEEIVPVPSEEVVPVPSEKVVPVPSEEVVPAPKKLTLAEKVTSEISKIAAMESHDNKECLTSLKALSKLYWNHLSKRPLIGDQFVSENLPALLVKMLSSFNSIGLFKNDDVWFAAYYTYNLCWNYSDGSYPFAKDLIKHGLVAFLGSNISHQPYLDNISSKNVYYVLKASLSILQNLSRAADKQEEFETFETANIKEKIQANFLSSADDFLRTLSTMTLTAIISEEENKMLEDTGAIPYMVKTLGLALSNTKIRRHKGFCPGELVECICRMSINDKNKQTMVNEGALPHLVKMMQHTDLNEQAMAAKTVWNLSFDADLRQKIRDEPGLIEALEALKDSEDKNVEKNCRGALWTLNEAHREVTEDVDAAKDHVFISYAWSNQPMVKQINEALKSAGFRTWVDFEQMGGSTLEAMATAIENAAVVVICASEKYKQSPNCRTEAEYTFQIKKPILPLMMQRRYKPDGWLGMLLGAKFYINFDGKYEFDVAFSMLLKELAGRGRDKDPDSPDQEPESPHGVSETDGVFQAQTVPLTESTPPTNTTLTGISQWSKDEVADFFQKDTLSGVQQYFQNYDGKMLSSLQRLRNEAPEFFFRHLQDKLCLDLEDILKLMSELDGIP